MSPAPSSQDVAAWLRAAAREDEDRAAKAAFNLGKLSRREGRTEEARDWLGKAAASANPQVWCRAAELLAALEGDGGDFPSAERWVERAEAGPRDTSASRFALGEKYLSAGHEDDARRCFETTAGADDPKIAALSRFRLGSIHSHAGHLEDAIGWWKQAATSTDTDLAAASMYNLAEVLNRHGGSEEARAWYISTLAVDDPEVSPKALLNLGALEEDAGQLEAARFRYRQVLALDGAPSQRWRAASRLAATLTDGHRFDEAETMLNEALERAEGDQRGELLLVLAGTALQQEHMPDGIQHLERARELATPGSALEDKVNTVAAILAGPPS